jgi:hypothetical protein
MEYTNSYFRCKYTFRFRAPAFWVMNSIFPRSPFPVQFLLNTWVLSSPDCTITLWRVNFEPYQGAFVPERKNSDWSLWIIFMFDGFVQLHSCMPYVIWALLCTCIVEVCFLRIHLIYGSKARTFLVDLSLTSDALFWRVSAMSVFGGGTSPSIVLRFEPVFAYFWW